MLGAAPDDNHGHWALRLFADGFVHVRVIEMVLRYPFGRPGVELDVMNEVVALAEKACAKVAFA